MPKGSVAESSLGSAGSSMSLKFPQEIAGLYSAWSASATIFKYSANQFSLATFPQTDTLSAQSNTVIAKMRAYWYDNEAV